MAEDINQRYIEEYKKNEYDANRHMVFVNMAAGIALFIIWILFLTKLFPLHENIYILVNITFPIAVIILLTPLIYLKTKSIKKPGFKNFLIASFIMVMFIVNSIIPKHAVLGWALCIFMTNQYYNPKLGKTTFVAVLICALLAMYFGMFVGEYDPHLLTDGILNGEILYPVDANGNYYYPDSPQERYQMLHELLIKGENRYLKILAYYYTARAIFLTLIFLVSNTLNKRTYKLLVSEIKVNNEQQKISTELNVAKEIQLSTLPDEFASNKNVEILAELKAAKEVGGDFYNYIKLGDHHVAVVIGDVSGKGVPAAMFMMKTITCFKNFLNENKNPSQVLKEVNKTIYEGNINQMFVTCFLAILNTETGVLRYSNAGHNPPIIGKNRQYHYLKCNSGFILGGMPDAYVIDEEIKLNEGDCLTLYTDGITEARNDKGEFYGEDRLINFFNSQDFTSVIHLHHELKDSVAGFVNGAEQSDDMTFLTLKYRGDEYFYSEHLCDGIQDNIPVLLDFIKDFCTKHQLLNSIKNNLIVVGDELISNIVKYGYKDKKGQVFLRLLFNVTKNEFTMTIIDTGEQFNQFDVNNAPIEGDITDRPVGGLGILIVKKIMTEYAYDRVNDKNIITLKKKM